MNAFIQLKSDSKKLQFGPKKCKKLHIGKYCVKYKCDTLEVDSWTEVQIINDETGISEIEDNCEGKEIMEERTDEKYLGDLISKDGKNTKNIKARIRKGTGIVEKIMTMLEGIPFGKFYFEIAIILRNSLLISSLLCNSEAWYKLDKRRFEFTGNCRYTLVKKSVKSTLVNTKGNVIFGAWVHTVKRNNKKKKNTISTIYSKTR